MGDGVRGPGVRYDATARQESHLLLFSLLQFYLTVSGLKFAMRDKSRRAVKTYKYT